MNWSKSEDATHKCLVVFQAVLVLCDNGCPGISHHGGGHFPWSSTLD